MNMPTKETMNLYNHVFIQWISSKNMLEDWMEEYVRYNNGRSLEMIHHLSVRSLTVRLNWAVDECKWKHVYKEWKEITEKLDKELGIEE